MNPIPLLELIAGTLALPPEEVTEATSMDNTTKWDSLRHLMLMTELEMQYGIELTDAEMNAAKSVTKIRETLRSKGKE